VHFAICVEGLKKQSKLSEAAQETTNQPDGGRGNQ